MNTTTNDGAATNLVASTLPAAFQTAFVFLAAESMSDGNELDKRVFRHCWSALTGDALARQIIILTMYHGEMSGSARQMLDLMNGHITLNRALFDVMNSGISKGYLLAVAEELKQTLAEGADLNEEVLRHNVAARLA